MEIKLDGIVNPELKEFLLSQQGITDVDINYDDCFVKLNIKFNEKTSSIIIMKYMIMRMIIQRLFTQNLITINFFLWEMLVLKQNKT